MSVYQNKKIKLMTVLLLSVFLTNTVFAGPLCSLAEDVKDDINQKFVKNLAVGIESENTGLKISCIYFAGFYELEELAGNLIAQLKNERDPDVRILIALSLYKIGNEEALEAVEDLVKSDMNLKVKKMAMAILNEMKVSPESNSITSAHK